MLKKMNREEQTPIDEVLDLINTQQKAIKTADEIIKLKNEMIKICEQETAFHKRIARRRGITILILSTWMIITSLINLCKLL